MSNITKPFIDSKEERESDTHWSIFRTIKKLDVIYKYSLAVLGFPGMDSEEVLSNTPVKRNFFSVIFSLLVVFVLPILMVSTLPLASFIFIIRTFWKMLEFKVYSMGITSKIVSTTGKFADYRRYCIHRHHVRMSIEGFYLVAEKYKYVIFNLFLVYMIYIATVVIKINVFSNNMEKLFQIISGIIAFLANALEIYQAAFEYRQDVGEYFKSIGVEEDVYDNPFTSRMTVEDQIKEVWKGHFILYSCKAHNKKVMLLKTNTDFNKVDYLMREVIEEGLLKNLDQITLVYMDDADFNKILEPVQCKVIIQGINEPYSPRKMGILHVIHVLLQKLVIDKTVLDVMSVVLLIMTVVYFFTQIKLVMKVTLATLVGIFVILVYVNRRAYYKCHFVNLNEKLFIPALVSREIDRKNDNFGFHSVLSKIITRHVFEVCMLTLLCMMNYDPYTKGLKFKDFILLLKILCEYGRFKIYVAVDDQVLCSIPKQHQETLQINSAENMNADNNVGNLNAILHAVQHHSASNDEELHLQQEPQTELSYKTNLDQPNSFHIQLSPMRNSEVEADTTAAREQRPSLQQQEVQRRRPKNSINFLFIRVFRNGNIAATTTPTEVQVTKDFNTFLFEIYEQELHYDFYVK